MSDREINIRSVLFLVIGILLVLSLVICIYIVVGEGDLVETTATVDKVYDDNDGVGKNTVSVIYEVNGLTYEYNFRNKNGLKKGNEITIFYHKNSITSVQTFKTSKIIFICPIIGLILCGLGLYELLKKSKNEMPVIDKVIDKEEPKSINLTVPSPVEPIPTSAATPELEINKKIEKEEVVKTIDEGIPAVKNTLVTEITIPEYKEEKTETPVIPNVEEQHEVVSPANLPVKKEEPTYKEEKVQTSSDSSNMKSLDEVAEKVKESVSQNINNSTSEEDIKDVIRSVLKEVIKEVNEEKEQPKKVEQQRIIPNYFYISGTSLIYEEVGKKAKELNLKDIKRIVRTINSAGNVVKLVVSNEEYKIILTNMKNIDLEQLANLLHNKMRTIDDTFKEEIERKEY